MKFLIKKLSKIIRKSPEIEHEIIIIGPKKYNELYSKIGNLNKLLAWGHATCIEKLCEKRPDCNRALSDQFARASVLISSLGKRGKKIKIEQRTKAEADIAVATASILARDAFVTWIDKATEQFGFSIPKGASNKVQEAGEKLVAQHGTEILVEVSKIHIKTAQNWL